ncbi:chloride channel protein [Xanthomonas citri]|uniref:chloride channel protein n=1 Tax=Xanthomonas arboricola TaxID=56448 RepID=UPI0011883FBC|nr:chloride channel protein [Xanthomonas arboricola]
MSYRPQNNHDGLWWQIALGIFVGQVMTAALAATVAVCLGFFTMHSLTTSLPASKTPRIPTHLGTPTPHEWKRPLRDDERCIEGNRLRKLNNGWQQLPHDPC